MPVHLPAPAKVSIAGHEVAPIAWGMWRFAGVDLAPARARIDAAFEVGVTLFDTADISGFDTPGGFGSAEHIHGEVFGDAPGRPGEKRRELTGESRYARGSRR